MLCFQNCFYYNEANKKEGAYFFLLPGDMGVGKCKKTFFVFHSLIDFTLISILQVPTNFLLNNYLVMLFLRIDQIEPKCGM